MQTEKAKESALRRQAKRQDLVLHKSRGRTPETYDFGTYQLVDYYNRLVCGDGNLANGFGMTLEEIESYLNS